MIFRAIATCSALEVASLPLPAHAGPGVLPDRNSSLPACTELTKFAAGAASQKYGQGLAEQQEIMGALADCAIEVYALESCLLRAGKMRRAKQAIAMTQYYAVKSLQIVELAARKVIAAVAEGDMLRTQMAILRRLAKYQPADTVAVGRQIARHVIAAGRYAL